MHLRVPLQLNSYGSRNGRSLSFFGVSESDWSEQTLIPLSSISPSPINRLRFMWALPQENPSLCLLPQGPSALQRTPSSNNSPKRRVTIQTSPLFTVRLLSFYPTQKLVLQIHTMYFIDAFILRFHTLIQILYHRFL